MKDKSYNQFCALACALDLVGERWTLLIVRELLNGPRRYKDLFDGLPDISTNLLSERLKTLERHGLVYRRFLPPPAGSAVYDLTPSGRSLENAVLELGRWGSQFLPASLEGVCVPSMGAASLAIKAFFRPEQTRGVNETYELHLDDEILQVHFQDGEMNVRQGPAAKADVILHTDMETFFAIFAGQIQPQAALDSGRLKVDGDPDEVSRFFRFSGVPSVPLAQLVP